MRCSFVETVVGLKVPAIFLSNASKVPGLPSLDRVAWGDFPGFTGSMKSSDISSPSRIPPVSLGIRYLRWVMGFAPPGTSPDPRVALVHGHRWTGPIEIAGDGRLSQLPGEPCTIREKSRSGRIELDGGGPLARSARGTLHLECYTWTCTRAREPWDTSGRKLRFERQYRAE